MRLVGISLLGRHDQDVIAESTQSLELDIVDVNPNSEDAVWLGLPQVIASLKGFPNSNLADVRIRRTGTMPSASTPSEQQ